jgi:arylsulfatase A-like enzyme
MSGGKKARWADEDLTDTFATKTVEFIERNKDRPFFLYVATHTAHEPFVPAKRFIGTSDAGTRGDVIQELDWNVGQIMNALKDQGIADNTIVIFASDNGAGWPAERFAYKYDDKEGNYRYNGALNGGKAQAYEGGTRVPLIVRWPGKIKPGTTSSQIISLVDMQATCAALVGVELPENAGQDTKNMLPALLGTGPGRDFVIQEHCRGAGNLAIRKGRWKLIPREGGNYELFDLSKDLGETKNLALQNPEIVESMKQLLDDVRRGEK